MIKFFTVLAMVFFLSLASLSAKENELWKKTHEADAAEITVVNARSSLMSKLDALVAGVEKIKPLNTDSIGLITNEIEEYEGVSSDHTQGMSELIDKIGEAVRLASSLSKEKRLSNQERAFFWGWLRQKKEALGTIGKPPIPPDVLRAEEILRRKYASQKIEKQLSKT
jgi:hypothetical protein